MSEGLFDSVDAWTVEYLADLRRWLRQWVAAHNAHDVEALTDLVTEDVVWVDPAFFGQKLAGRDEFAGMLEGSFAAFPDLEVEQGAPCLSVESDRVVVPWRLRGTFTGDLRRPGEGGLAPKATGRKIDLRGVDLYIFEGNQLASGESVHDVFEMTRQLGLLSDPNGKLARAGLRMQRLTAPLARRFSRSALGL